MSFSRKSLSVVLLTGALTLSACAGENADAQETDTLRIDYATYNPLSLIIKDQRWLEDELDGNVEWVYSAGSNKANENLRAEAIDVGSAAGSATLLTRATGTPIQTLDVVGQVEWTALVVPEDSDIASVTDLSGKTVAATRGTDPYFFLVQALEDAGVELSDVDIQNIQHADGRTALDNGSVDAWAGLDPIMAGAEGETEFLHRDVDLNTYSFVNATESFVEDSPEVAQTVVNTYERARAWALEHPEETAQLLAEEADIDLDVAEIVIRERSGFDVSPVPGEQQAQVLSNIAPIFVTSGDVDSQDDVDEALETLFAPEFAEHAESAE